MITDNQQLVNFDHCYNKSMGALGLQQKYVHVEKCFPKIP